EVPEPQPSFAADTTATGVIQADFGRITGLGTRYWRTRTLESAATRRSSNRAQLAYTGVRLRSPLPAIPPYPDADEMVHAYDCIDEWRARRARAQSMLLALDFDGTLAPIVPQPDQATLLPGARRAIQRLLDRADTRIAIVSGRALADARERVGLQGVYYAGNHGLEIEGPDVERIHPEALAATHAVAECRAALEREFAAEPEVLVEDKHLSLSVHFRLMADETREA